MSLSQMFSSAAYALDFMRLGEPWGQGDLLDALQWLEKSFPRGHFSTFKAAIFGDLQDGLVLNRALYSLREGDRSAGMYRYAEEIYPIYCAEMENLARAALAQANTEEILRAIHFCLALSKEAFNAEAPFIRRAA